MTGDWQILAVGICLTWAVWIVAKRILALCRPAGASGCGTGCQSCSSNPPTANQAFVPLDSLQTETVK
ncbi:MAG: hypothetical protein ACKVT0_17845 [Planctomycetaceae bacterium]